MPKCTGALSFQCQSGGQDTIASLGVCVKCYAYARANRKAYDPGTHRTVAASPWEQRRQANGNWKLGTLAFDPHSGDNRNDARLIGKEIYKSLTNKITTDADTPAQDLADVSSMAGLLNDAAQTLLAKNPTAECVAVCLVGRTLIVGANAALPAHPGTLKSIVALLDDQVLGEAKVSRVILLGAAQPRAATRGGNGTFGPYGLALPAVDTRVNVHAEIRILELLHLTMAVNGGTQLIDSTHAAVEMDTTPNALAPLGWWDFSKKIYLGVDRPCCAKCYTTIRAYNAGNHLAPYTFMFQGHHHMYPFEWRLPQGLRMLRTAIEYNKLKYATT